MDLEDDCTYPCCFSVLTRVPIVPDGVNALLLWVIYLCEKSGGVVIAFLMTYGPLLCFIIAVTLAMAIIYFNGELDD